jgi:hypothetical protein
VPSLAPLRDGTAQNDNPRTPVILNRIPKESQT